MPKNSNNSGTEPRKNFVAEQVAKFRRLLHTSRGKDILLFLFFLCVSYGFWLILRLNDEMQRDFTLPLQIVDVPDDVKFISEMPSEVSVTIRDTGVALSRVSYGRTPRLVVKYSSLVHDENAKKLVLTKQSINSHVRDIFGGSAQIVSIIPDSMSIFYTDRPAVRVPVVADVEVQTVLQCEQIGNIVTYPDSVDVYMAGGKVKPPKAIYTEHYVTAELSDTLRVTLRLNPGESALVEPASVKTVIPVEPMIHTSKRVNISLINPGSNIVFVTPSDVELSYFLPMSKYGAEDEQFVVTADFSKRAAGKVPLEIESAPSYARNARLVTDSVRYYIEVPAEVMIGED